MSDRWIVGVDGSTESHAALRWAQCQSVGRDVVLDVVRAHRQPLADRVLGSGAEPSAAADDGTVEHRVVIGSPGRALVEEARDASLLVVGRHGAGGGWHHTLGSVSRHCVAHSSAPTVVVPKGWTAESCAGEPGRVLVGFDGSDGARPALEWAMAFAGPESEIRVLIAIEIAPWLTEDLVRARLGDEIDVEEQRLRGLLDATDLDDRVRVDVVVGDARPALADGAASADLVVLGSHGSGRHGTALIGSVSTWMLDGSTTPVVVVPRPA